VRLIAILTIFAFACATVRVPAARPDELADAPGTVAQPSVELWLESSDAVSQRQSDSAADAARAALAQALSEVRISSSAMGAEDAVLFVRERGIALTPERQHQQTWAKVGIALGVVVVLAVLIATASRNRGGPRLTRARPGGRPGSGQFVRPFVPRYAPGPPIFIGFNIFVPVQPMVYQPAADEVPFPPDPPAPLSDALSEPAPAPPDEPAIELPPLEPPADFSVGERGFFDGTHLALQLDLVDRRTGEVLWSKPVASDGDPCNLGDVRHLLREALAKEPWATPAVSAPRW
jgi:ElaB/YqjD/DUF883 family membrane-anchored ribosome-binding protein